MAGQVTVDGERAGKPGADVRDVATVVVAERPRFVSRGGEKLCGALDDLSVSAEGARALDLGASTGGFTDCLIQRGAAEVVALDVGYGQLDWSLRHDPRVHVMERVNARHLRPDDLPYAPDLVACDVAFISVATLWPAVVSCLAPGWRALILVKPQFEVGRDAVGRGGVVREPGLRADAVRRVAGALEELGGSALGLVESRLAGPRGNRELVLYACDRRVARGAIDIEHAIPQVIA